MPAIGVQKVVKVVKVDELRPKLLVARAEKLSYTVPADAVAEQVCAEVQEWDEVLNYHVSSWSSERPGAIGCRLTVDLDGSRR